jgi:hypothetical protein
LAKKRRQKIEKREDYDFKFPEFDEHQYISLELNKAKASLVAFLFAIVMVILTYQFYLVTHPDARGPVVLGFFAVFALPFIIRWAKVDISDFDWKNWLGSGAVYVMSWLAIFILVLNSPFSDFIEPHIDEDTVQFYYIKAGDDPNIWYEWNTSDDPPTMKVPVKIKISVKITDNTEVDKDSVKITIQGPFNGTINRKMNYDSEDRYIVEIENNGEPFNSSNKPYSYTITVKDTHGYKSEYIGKFQIP